MVTCVRAADRSDAGAAQDPNPLGVDVRIGLVSSPACSSYRVDAFDVSAALTTQRDRTVADGIINSIGSNRSARRRHQEQREQQ